jgi:signal transduction histidine kinase
MTDTLARPAQPPARLRLARAAPAPRTGRPAFGYLAIGAALSVASLTTHGLSNDVLYEAIAASCIAATVIGILRNRPSTSLPWWLLAGGMSMWFLGDLFWDWYPHLTGRELPSPSVADGAYLLGYPLLLASIALIVRTRGTVLRRSGWIDAAIVAVVFAILIWEFALDRYLVDGITMTEAVNFLYPLMDAVLIGFLARMLFAPGPRTQSYVLLVGAIGLTLVADAAYAHVVATGWWSIYDTIKIGWLAGYVLIGAAALHPSMITIADEQERREHPLTRRRAVVLTVVASLPIVEMVVSSSLGGDDSNIDVGVGMLLVLGMVFYRLSSLIGSIERQTLELSTLHEERGLVLDEITRAIEEERTRLSAELHDGPIQRVTALGMRAYMGVQKLRTGDQGATAKALEQIEVGLDGEVRALRALMARLRPPVLSEQGLVDALNDYAETLTSEYGIVTIVEGAIDGRLKPDVETGLYRIAQEALTNARRHSGARRIDVRVDAASGRVRLTVRDDGSGFDAGAKLGHDRGQHYGLLAMRERAKMLRGSLSVTSARGEGTTVVADVPLERAADAPGPDDLA